MAAAESGSAPGVWAWSPASRRWPRAAWRWAWSWSGGSSASGSRAAAEAEVEDVLRAPRSDGPKVTTPDGVVLHTEVDESEADRRPGSDPWSLVHGYALNMDCWHFQRKHFRGRLRSVLYDQRSHGRSSRPQPEQCRLPQLAEDLPQVLDEVVGRRARWCWSGTRWAA